MNLLVPNFAFLFYHSVLTDSLEDKAGFQLEQAQIASKHHENFNISSSTHH